ncbi:MAG: hypothetical protein HZB50_02095 [Chloroflexi bacterium]|nr:hypothetical protein [Chloroflexota bacterium]
MKSRWAEYGGKPVLYIDLSNFKDDIKGFETEITTAIKTLGQRMYEQPPHSVLVLVDLSNTTLSQNANHFLSEAIKDTKKYVKRTAVVGMTGIRKMFLDYFAMLANSDTGSFTDTDSAIKWLLAAK